MYAPLEYFKEIRETYIDSGFKILNKIGVDNKDLGLSYKEINFLLPYLESDLFSGLEEYSYFDKLVELVKISEDYDKLIKVPDELKGDRYEDLYRFLSKKVYEYASMYSKGDEDCDIISGVCGALVVYQWGYFKKVYSIDQDFLSVLTRTNSVKFYREELKRLPYNSFFIDLSNADFGIRTPMLDTLFGIYVHVFWDEGEVLSNNDPIIELCTLYKDIGLNGFETSRIFFPLFDEGDDCCTIDLDTALTNNILAVVALQFILFLVSSNTDIVESEDTKNTFDERYIHKDTYKGIQKWDVGYRYGAKIRAFNQEQSHQSGVAVGDKNRPRPHTRNAHWHHYWCGSGDDKHLELRWVHPCFVNGTDVVTTISEVTTQEAQCSSGEELIKAYLSKQGYAFEKEYIVAVKGHSRRFDFCVSTDKGKVFIEFDGEQHFKSVEQFGGADAFKERRKVDFDKNKYARKNKIPLLRIRYDQKAEIPCLIDKFLSKPSMHSLNPELSNSDYYNI